MYSLFIASPQQTTEARHKYVYFSKRTSFIMALIWRDKYRVRGIDLKFFLKKIYLFILAVLVLCCYMQSSSSCSKWEVLSSCSA